MKKLEKERSKPLFDAAVAAAANAAAAGAEAAELPQYTYLLPPKLHQKSVGCNDR